MDQNDEDSATQATVAAYSGMIDMKPADPIEGSQLIAANQASLSMFTRTWALPPEQFEARMKYLALPDKAARTVSILTERLDHHRGRGHQQIIVKHVTVNADQAVVTDQIVSGKVKDGALLTSGTEKPVESLQPSQRNE